MVPLVRHLLRVVERGILALRPFPADALRLLHGVLFLVALRLGLARRVVDLARVHELLRALVVVLAARVAALAFDLVLAFHRPLHVAVAPPHAARRMPRTCGRDRSR